MLAPLVSLWVPHAYVVSFKLETDENLLIAKARDSLKKYKHKVYVAELYELISHITDSPFILQLVIANILQTRRQRVVFVTPDSTYELVLTREQLHSGMEIEDSIVSSVVANHMDYVHKTKH